jgi:hypothetical protein
LKQFTMLRTPIGKCQGGGKRGRNALIIPYLWRTILCWFESPENDQGSAGVTAPKTAPKMVRTAQVVL